MAELADEGLKRVEKQAKLERSELDTLSNKGVVKEVAEEVAEGERANARAERRVAIGKCVDLLEDGGPLGGRLGVPESIRVGHWLIELGDREERSSVVEEGEVLVDHSP